MKHQELVEWMEIRWGYRFEGAPVVYNEQESRMWGEKRLWESKSLWTGVLDRDLETSWVLIIDLFLVGERHCELAREHMERQAECQQPVSQFLLGPYDGGGL